MATIALGLFAEPGAALAAAATLKRASFPCPELMSPVPIEGVEAVLGEKVSVIKRFTFVGAVCGGMVGFALAAGTAVLYLHPTGGRPIITIPPFLIIAYELTILFGILATVLGFFLSARLPVIKERVYVPATAVDKFAVTVACDSQQHFDQAEEILSTAGAEEVRQLEEEA